MNYKELGFKCGIEIHQQLSTETKLFCDCPIDLEDEAADSQVKRYLRAVKGESGGKDHAAEVEEMKDRKFVYNYYKRNNCLVEIDEEPPHEMDEEALETALTFTRMIDAKIPAEIQVMRKMVIDGSNTSGFQRTAMIGLDGELETESGTVSIEDIELEEESAGIHERTQEKAVYDLNRLGIPLIEVGTDASVKNPEHAREVAEKIGMLLRSTGKARRGLGTIRQDVNVSIEEGARVEIKGFQDVRNIDKLIELEVERQKNLVELGENLNSDSEVVGDNVTYVFEGTDNEMVSTVLENDGAVYALKLPKMTGKMKEKISRERYLAKELVDYARNQGPRGIIHTDEDIGGYGLEEEFEELADIFDKEQEDVIAIIAAEEQKAKKAAQEVKRRAEMLYEQEVPEETRSAEQDFTTSYSRPLPGAARMYPETDIPPIQISDKRIKEVGNNLPDTLEEREKKYSEEIGDELASQIVHSKKLLIFEELKQKFNPKLAANTLTNTYSRLESEGVKVEKLAEEHFKSLFEALEDGLIAKGDIEKVLEKMVHMPPEEAIEKVAESKTSEEEIREVVQNVINEKEEMIEEQGMRAQGALMGLVMGRVEADGGTVSKILEEELKKEV
ncbi:MAG: Glu-tRNA(Gln) amidotransferase GatDE subunit E [Nanohaloarchaea archaeon SW_7_43_1]|nr:MAG: Glu-tRNA(Gln) amidotransferase GatDE subunit E [Nanohaloarchaea archaeon SW_7_43_1]